MKKPKTVFAECDGKLYVQTQAVMGQLVALIDGLPIARFNGDKNWYLPIDVAIGWCKKEMQFHGAEKYRVMIEVMEKAKAQCVPLDTDQQNDTISNTKG